ncbi:MULTISPECIES: DUF427 domain-containing protein [Legionella]|uniref:DUF427 domain-containing protein n=1 Tax=Legionella maceachernii TaxID=466 RepID=A0A0W0WGM9_9GAMM|nr:DUF427 domain-containing protein [Legionella maceachernii]KTD31411.1 hypothetical protein Lmac_0286 [Legionella maceachernii]SKA23219.1 Uncharacterized conserved protein, DUF427 family [Legionella maceachernii]SUQ35548.1 Domain of uncharacterised function (DUF427) [Legionella maceachernii]
MENKPIKTPGADHPITIEKNPNRIMVIVGGKVVADTYNALTLREADYPPVHYIPRQNVNMALLQRQAQKTYCPYKGNCSYYTISANGQKRETAAWSYETPYTAVEPIKEYIAFYPDRVDAVSETQFA